MAFFPARDAANGGGGGCAPPFGGPAAVLGPPSVLLATKGADPAPARPGPTLLCRAPNGALGGGGGLARAVFSSFSSSIEHTITHSHWPLRTRVSSASIVVFAPVVSLSAGARRECALRLRTGSTPLHTGFTALFFVADDALDPLFLKAA